MDALTTAYTTYSHVLYLNNMSARHNENHKKYHQVYGIEQKYLYRDKNNKLLFKPPMPLNEFRSDAKKHLEDILISFKAKNKVVTRNKNKIKIKGKDKYKTKIELTPRGQLHKETVYGKIEQYVTKEEKIGTKFDLEKIEQIANKSFKDAVLKRFKENNSDPKKAFGGKNAPNKKPIFVDNDNTIEVPEKVKLVWKEDNYTIRKDINPDLKIDKVIDAGVKRILGKRIEEFKGDSKMAFSNLDENPIWLNKEKGISVKRVTISGVSNAEALHDKKDHNGNFILNKDGNTQAVDFVSTGNNHHVAIYRDEKGNLQEEVVSFYEAVHRVNAGLPIIDKNKEGMEFLFTMKQNEYFVFPSNNFKPDEIDLLNPDNTSMISPHLFRVQKIGSLLSGFWFRHHLETTVDVNKSLKGVAYKRIQSTSNLKGIIKVRINHLGQIVKVGEY